MCLICTFLFASDLYSLIEIIKLRINVLNKSKLEAKNPEMIGSRIVIVHRFISV